MKGAASLSLRIPDPMAAKLRTMAALEQRSMGELVRLLAEEALKQREFPEIVFVDGPTGRRARLTEGPDVWEVIEPYVLAGCNWEALRASYPELDERWLRAAIRYYDQYPEEIDARIALNQRG
ncbi:MAG: ribbon-helix-helix protein, CopG family [Chloroflexota bacterium]